MFRIEIGYKNGDSFIRNLYSYSNDLLKFDLFVARAINNNTDIYVSAYSCNEDKVLCGMPYFDIDVDGAAEDPVAFLKAKNEELKLVDYIEENLGIKKESLDIYFSGSKGFHTVIPVIFKSKNLNLFFKEIAMRAKESIHDLDTRIYDERRVLRLVNSVHSKSGLCKVKVSYDSLKQYNLESMRNWASTTRVISKSKRVVNRDKIDDYFKSFDSLTANQERTRKPASLREKPTNIIRKIKDIIYKGKSNNRNKRYITSENRINAIKKLDYKFFDQIFNYEHQTVNYQTALYMIKHDLDMTELIAQYRTPFSCILHVDNHPSAAIRSPRTTADGTVYENWIYFCNSPKCKKEQYNNIDLVKEIAGCNDSKAFDFCRRILHLTIEGGSKKDTVTNEKDIQTIIADSYSALTEISSENKKYGKILSQLKSTFAALTDIALKTAQNCCLNGDIYFFASKRYLASKSYQDAKETYKKTVLLAALNIITKVDDDEIPAAVKKETIKYNTACEAKFGRTIQCYKINDIYTLKSMFCIRRALDAWIEQKGSVRTINRAKIAKIFSEEVASRVYVKTTRIAIATKAA